MRPTEARKRLLIAESDIHRAQWSSEFAEWREGVRVLAHRVTAVSAIASAVVVTMTGWSAWRRGRPGHATGRTPWVRPLIRVVGVLSTLWMTWRSRQEGGEESARGAGKEKS